MITEPLHSLLRESISAGLNKLEPGSSLPDEVTVHTTRVSICDAHGFHLVASFIWQGGIYNAEVDPDFFTEAMLLSHIETVEQLIREWR